MFKSVLVLESSWDPASVVSQSVWPFASEFANVAGLKAYHQTFSDKNSFLHWISRFNKEAIKGPKLLYVAAHRSKGRIGGLRRDINSKTVIGALKKAKRIPYVHFGSCLFGKKSNLKKLLSTAKHIKWAAGYDQSVGWLDSTLFDIMLWGRIAHRDAASQGQKTHTIAKQLLAETPGLAKNLGFQFQYRYGKSVNSL